MDIFSMARSATLMRLHETASKTIENTLDSLADVELSDSQKQQLVVLLALASTGAVFQVAQGK